MEEDNPKGLVHLDGWAGRASFKITIIEELKKSYRVRFEEDCQYGRWIRKQGEIGLVPKRAVTKT